MAVHVLLDTTFFRTSMPIAAQQRILPLPPNRGLNEGDTIFLRNESGALTWVAEVILTGEFESTSTWSGKETATERYAISGYLARIHDGVLPPGKSKLQSPWVTLNRRTLETTLPWWDTHVLLFHSTLHLVEGILTPEEVREGLRLNCLMQYPSGHIVVPHGEARKRLLVHVKGVELQCGLCHGPIASIEEATQDHVIPISQGGPDALSNIELTHRTCNELKGNALPEQYPPIFPVPGSENGSWRSSSFRHGRHVHHRRNNRRGPGANSGPMRRTQSNTFTAPVRGTGIPSSMQEELTQRLQQPKAADSTVVDASGSAASGTLSQPQAGQGAQGSTQTPPSKGRNAGKGSSHRSPARGSSSNDTPQSNAAARSDDSVSERLSTSAAKAKEPQRTPQPSTPKQEVEQKAAEQKPAEKQVAEKQAAEPKAPEQPVAEKPGAEPAAGQQVTEQPAAEQQATGQTSAVSKNGLVEVDPEWLTHVQNCTWDELMQLAVERDWAAKTAALRTLEQLSRAEGKTARADGKLLAEAEGPKGRFTLYAWKEQIILTEERGNRHSYFLVKEMAAINWETYLWYLKHFGRTTPLSVAMSLLALWRQGESESDSRVRAEKNGQAFHMQLEDGQLRVIEGEASSDVA